MGCDFGSGNSECVLEGGVEREVKGYDIMKPKSRVWMYGVVPACVLAVGFLLTSASFAAAVQQYGDGDRSVLCGMVFGDECTWRGGGNA